ncbi:MAG: sigma-70 family RNA polymerase sigma factor [Bryobacterales bacterium]|nr:sigma-70 family RNA polymerase sigma factor [Bryobacterales bacterium]
MQLALVEKRSSSTRQTSDADVRDAFEAWHGLVFRTAYRITGSAADAEDVLQTVFLRLLAREGPAPEQPESYLRRAAINVSLTLLAQRHRAKPVPLEEATEAPATEDAELRLRLRRAIAQLDPKQAEMFALRYFEGYSNAEIAKLFNISSVRVAVTLYRIRLKLQEQV